MTRFPIAGPVTARIDIAVGDIAVGAEAADETVVEVVAADPTSEKDRRTAEATRVTCRDGALEVVGPRRDPGTIAGKPGAVRVSVAVPAGSALDATTAVGVIATTGPLGRLTAKTSAGDIRVQDAASADVRTGIGAVQVRHVAGDARCATGSGSVTIDHIEGRGMVNNANGDTSIGRIGDALRAKSANGSIRVDQARGDVVATTANGDLHLGSAERGTVVLRTSLGSITLGIPVGTTARLDLRTAWGTVRNDLEATEAPAGDERTVAVEAQTSAGDITIVRADLA